MNRENEHDDLIDLGAVSTETKGPFGVPEDSQSGLIPPTGLEVE